MSGLKTMWDSGQQVVKSRGNESAEAPIKGPRLVEQVEKVKEHRKLPGRQKEGHNASTGLGPSWGNLGAKRSMKERGSKASLFLARGR